MMNWFLRAKHWQLFLLTFGVMMIAYMMIMYFVFADIMSMTAAGRAPDPMVMFRAMRFLPVIVIFVMLMMMGWNWSVAIGLQKKLPSGVTMKTNLFKVFLIIPVVYTTAFIFLVGILFSEILEVSAGDGAPDGIVLSWMSFFPFIIPLHFFSLFCIFYNMYFVSKTIKTVELQRATTFSDFVGEFFLIWFYPIGVWILQPRINALYEKGPGSLYGAIDSTVLDETIRN